MKLPNNHYRHKYVAVIMYHSVYEKRRGEKPKVTTGMEFLLRVDR